MTVRYAHLAPKHRPLQPSSDSTLLPRIKLMTPLLTSALRLPDQEQPYRSKHFVRITLQRKAPGGGMAYAGDLKSIRPIWHHRVPATHQRENSCVYALFMIYTPRCSAHRGEGNRKANRHQSCAVSMHPEGHRLAGAAKECRSLRTGTFLAHDCAFRAWNRAPLSRS